MCFAKLLKAKSLIVEKALSLFLSLLSVSLLLFSEANKLTLSLISSYSVMCFTNMLLLKIVEQFV